MPAPGAPLQVCALVWYFNGLSSSNSTPNIGIYALVDPVDAVSPAILMRVERCTGAACTDYVLRGNSSGVAFTATPDPQAEYIDSGVYNTLYRYRVRLENSSGPGPYSATIDISTLVQGDSVCDTGTITDFADQIQLTGHRGIVEYGLDEVRLTGNRGITEWGLDEVRNTALRLTTEWMESQVRVTGLRIIYEWRLAGAADLRVVKTVDEETVNPGDEFTWTVTVDNLSTEPAFGVVVTDNIPAGGDYISHVASKGVFDPITGIWTIGTVNPSEVVTLAILCEAGETLGVITNTATVTGDNPDPNPDNNEDDAEVTIVAPSHVCPALPLPEDFEEDFTDTEQQDDVCQDEV